MDAEVCDEGVGVFTPTSRTAAVRSSGGADMARRRVLFRGGSTDVIPNRLLAMRRLASSSHGSRRPETSPNIPDTRRPTQTSPSLPPSISMDSKTRLLRPYPNMNLQYQRVRLGKIARIVGLTVVSGAFLFCLAIMFYLCPPRGPPPSSYSYSPSSSASGSGRPAHHHPHNSSSNHSHDHHQHVRSHSPAL